MATLVNGLMSPMTVSRIGRYEIKSLIGAGGMATCYLARDSNPKISRLVAIKVLNASIDSPDLRERFARESRALAALNHSNIVNIYDSGEFQGSPYIVMEYIRGETVAEKIKRRAPLTIGEKLKMMSGAVRRPCARARSGHHPPRHQARQSDGRSAPVPEDSRFRHRPRRRREHDASERAGDAVQHADRHAGLHVARTDRGGRNRPSQRYLRRRRGLLRASFIPRSLFRQQHETDREQGAAGSAGSPRVVDPRPRPRDRRHRGAGAARRIPTSDFRMQSHSSRRWSISAGGLGRLRNAAAVQIDTSSDADTRAGLGIARLTSRARLSAVDGGVPGRRGRCCAPLCHRGACGRSESSRRARVAGEDRPQLVDAPRLRFSNRRRSRSTRRRSVRRLRRRRRSSGPVHSPLRARASRSGESCTHGRDHGAISAFSGRRPRQQGWSSWDCWVSSSFGCSVGLAGHELTITKPTGGSILGRGVSCGTIGSDCTVTRPDGEAVELQAQPDEGFVFAGYTGDCAAGGRTIMSEARTCGARFDPIPEAPPAAQLALTITPPKGGTIVAMGELRAVRSTPSALRRFSRGPR